jgi:hypothetical protein
VGGAALPVGAAAISIAASGASKNTGLKDRIISPQ